MPAAALSEDASTVYARARKLVATLQFQLQQLEDGSAGDNNDTCAATENLSRLFSDVALLDRVVQETMDQQKRELWRKRAAQLATEAGALRHAIERYLKTTYSARRELTERRALLGGGGGADSISVDAFLQERASLTASHSMMDDVAAAAASAMGALRGQRGVLKGVHKRVLDMSSVLGASNAVMRLIERRTIGDKVIVYGGSVFIILLLVLVWWLTRG